MKEYSPANNRKGKQQLEEQLERVLIINRYFTPVTDKDLQTQGDQQSLKQRQPLLLRQLRLEFQLRETLKMIQM